LILGGTHRVRRGFPKTSRFPGFRPMARNGNFPDAGGPAMSVRPADRNTVPLGVAVLGALVVGTGWLVLQGLPFLVGCGLTLVLATAAVGLLTAHLRDG
jgi:hypothetical protein